ncbi:hypothetical protein Pcinc_037075 [Petrolisthes cinctipes]|uniref:Uncharacterized protein n=1 Tax=Petrolisthes cinctipes TaxID=88211 RepID=A0AAE1BTG8_PETCI|nr:hypothetical protein Pcinc_037075 [Petrolisthes cinctipes]
MMDGCLGDPSRSFKRPDVAATGPRGGVVQDSSRSRSRGQRAIRGLNQEEEGDSRGQPPTRQEGREEDELQCYRKWLEERRNIDAAGIGVGGAVTRVTSFIYFFQELTGGGDIIAAAGVVSGAVTHVTETSLNLFSRLICVWSPYQNSCNSPPPLLHEDQVSFAVFVVVPDSITAANVSLPRLPWICFGLHVFCTVNVLLHFVFVQVMKQTYFVWSPSSILESGYKSRQTRRRLMNNEGK